MRDALEAELTSGALAPGAQLPVEPELCARYGVGRHSVRRAIRALAIEGKLRVEQGRGTFVEYAPRITYTIGARTRLTDNLRAQGIAPSRVLRATETVSATPDVAAALEIAVGAPVYQSSRLVRGNEAPLALGTSYHSLLRFPDFVERRERLGSTTATYQSYGIKDYLRRETRVESRRARVEEAKDLKQHPEQPVFEVVSIDVDLEGRPLSLGLAVWSATRVTFRIETEGLSVNAPAHQQGDEEGTDG